MFSIVIGTYDISHNFKRISRLFLYRLYSDDIFGKPSQYTIPILSVNVVRLAIYRHFFC